jgi:hypothetical protein
LILKVAVGMSHPNSMASFEAQFYEFSDIISLSAIVLDRLVVPKVTRSGSKAARQ